MTDPQQRLRTLESEVRSLRKQIAKTKPPRIIQSRTSPSAPGQRQPRERDKGHMGAIAKLFCVATKIRTGAEAYGVQVCHVRFSLAEAGVRNPGMQNKSNDWRVLPLLPAEHARQHAGKEEAYWAALNIDPYALCKDLRAASPDVEAMLAVLRLACEQARRAA